MLLKSAMNQTFDMRKFGCLSHDDMSVSISADPSQKLFALAVLPNRTQTVALYDAIIKCWADGEYIFDIPVWLSKYRDE